MVYCGGVGGVVLTSPEPLKDTSRGWVITEKIQCEPVGQAGVESVCAGGVCSFGPRVQKGLSVYRCSLSAGP